MYFDDQLPLHYTEHHITLLTRMLVDMMALSERTQFKVTSIPLVEILTKRNLKDPVIIISEPLLALLINEILPPPKPKLFYVDSFNIYEGLYDVEKWNDQPQTVKNNVNFQDIRLTHIFRLLIVCKHFEHHIKNEIAFAPHPKFKRLLVDAKQSS